MRTLFLICLILLSQLASGTPVSADDSVSGSFTTGDYFPPSPVTDLSATGITPYSVNLHWTAPGDDGNIGMAAGYDIRYSVSPITTERKWLNSNNVYGGIPAPAPAGSNQTCIVSGLLPYTTYYFALKTVDDNSNWSTLSNCASVMTPVEYLDITQGGGIQPAQPVIEPATTPPDTGPIRIDIKGKRAVIFLGLLPDGTLARTMIITLNDSQLEMTIQKGTIFLDDTGKPISVIILEYVEPYGTPPSGYDFQATYSFQPSCVIEPSIEIKILYGFQAFQADVDESFISIASYNQNQNRWVTLTTTRDIITQVASTKIAYFSLFSLLVPKSRTISQSSNATMIPELNIENLTLSSKLIKPGDTLIVNFDAANIGSADGEFYLPLILDGATLDSKTVLIAALQEKAESFTVVLNEEGIHTIGVGSILTTVTVKKAVAAAAGGSPPLRTTLLWISICGLAITCIIVLINLWRKSKTSLRRL
jgi:hypothetical protein